MDQIHDGGKDADTDASQPRGDDEGAGDTTDDDDDDEGLGVAVAGVGVGGGKGTSAGLRGPRDKDAGVSMGESVDGDADTDEDVDASASASAGAGGDEGNARRRSPRLAHADRRPIVAERGLGVRGRSPLDDETKPQVKVSKVCDTVRTWDHSRRRSSRLNAPLALPPASTKASDAHTTVLAPLHGGASA
jgi:hypothetical protein